MQDPLTKNRQSNPADGGGLTASHGEKWPEMSLTQIPDWAMIHKNLPLSYAQRRMWFLDRMQPGEIAYINTSIFRLVGNLYLYALWRAFDEVVTRHAILRTTYATEDYGPVQVINENTGFHLPVVDLGAMTEFAQDQEEKRIFEMASQQPMVLAAEFPFKAIVVRRNTINHAVLWAIHHIATDGWSSGILMHELATLYNAYRHHEPNPLPPLPIQYADFALWQLTWLQGEELERQLDYWRKQLQGLRPLELPTDRARPAVQTYRGASQPITLTQDQTTRIKALMRQEHATLYMVLLAAFVVLMQRYTGQDDIVLGSPIANRNRKEVEGLIGFFVNTMVMRVDFSQVRTFHELIRKVREVALGAFMHQDLPFEKLVEELHPERSMSRTPLFQVIFALQNTPKLSMTFDELDVQHISSDITLTRFDLECHMYDNTSNIVGTMVYNKDIFDANTIRQMAESFQALIADITTDSEKYLSEYSIVPELQWTEMLFEWGSADRLYPQAQGVHELFDLMAQRIPDAVALVHRELQLTYTALYQRANQLAHYLIKLGVRSGTPVGICVNRSIDMVVGLLGILKAGGNYVPMDPKYPQERLAFMIADTNLKVMLTQTPLLNVLPEGNYYKVCFDDIWAEIVMASTDSPDVIVSPETPIYIMYTSGSTGYPKGIVIPHRAVVRLVTQSNYATLGKTEIIAQGSNIAFDAATFEIWGALLNGGKIEILDNDILLSPRLLEEELRARSITTMWMTAALFNAVAQENADAFASLHQLIIGGEVLNPKWVGKVLDRGSPGRLLNGYGPTETTTFASWYLINDVQEGTRTIPIGGPISNTQLLVLDKNLQPLPVGAVGELYIAGDGLAIGYVNNPCETAEKFLPNPFSKEPGLRMYRSGDMVRWLPEGVLEFVGRKDQQVKIRGFRIELAEIEDTLLRYPAIREACVIVHIKEEGDKQLIAYYVAGIENIADGQALRLYLKDHLPDYMIPSIYIRLESFPLTASGKIDRLRLPLPEEEMRTSDEMPAYLDNLEYLLTKIWKSVLEVDTVDRHANFFDAGGHSLLGVQLLDQINKYTGLEIPVSALFQAPTIAQMTALFKQKNWTPTWSAVVPISNEGHRPPLFLVPPAGNTVLGFAHIISAINSGQPVFGLMYKGLDGLQVPQNRVEDIAAYFIHEIQKMHPTGPYILGGFCFGAHVAFEMARQFQAMNQQVPLVFILDASSPISGPSWTGGALIKKDLAYYAKRLLLILQRKELAQTVIKKLANIKTGNPEHLLPVNENLLKNYKGIQQVFNANLNARAHYRAKPVLGRVVLITSELFYNFGYVQRWAELAPDDFKYEVFEQTTHRELLLDKTRGALIAQKMQVYLDQLYAEEDSQGKG